MPRLSPLVEQAFAAHPSLRPVIPGHLAQAEIASVTADSRQAAPGALFVAVPGVKDDGARYAQDALARGASAVMSEAPIPGVDAVIIVKNARLALSLIAAAFYPRQPECIVAVTGTDGKTSTADFTRQLWEMLGRKAASIGTLGTIGEGGREIYPGSHTTPDPVSLHRMLQEMADSGYTHVCMEASSHGLAQYRLDGVRLTAAAFTNLTRDHLDYHGTEEAYFAAKARLFSEVLPQGKTAVLNADDARYAALQHECVRRSITEWSYGKNGRELALRSCVPLPQGQRVEIAVFGKDNRLELPHVGAFQVFNMLAAAGLVLSEQANGVEEVLALLPRLKGVPGRLEYIASANGAAIYIDYAHTPAALANVLSVLRAHTNARLHVVFGCGGDRDRGKRPQMGAAACERADAVIVTDDNPRSEDPAAIRAEVMKGCDARAKPVAGRREAIHAAIGALEPWDVLLVAGKGHEKTQIIGGVSEPFDDAEVIREAVNRA